MNLLTVPTKEPATRLELEHNIDLMLAGKPFWSPAPKEMAKVPTDLANNILQDALEKTYKPYPPFFEPLHDEMEAIFRGVVDDKEEDLGSFYLIAGMFVSAPNNNTWQMHVDSFQRSGYRYAAKSLKAAGESTTLYISGPCMMLSKSGELPNNVREIILSTESNYSYIGLDNQPAESTEQDTIYVFEPGAVHREPPRTAIENRDEAVSRYLATLAVGY